MPLPTGFLGGSQYLSTYNPYTWSGWGNTSGRSTGGYSLGRTDWSGVRTPEQIARMNTGGGLAGQYQSAYDAAKTANEKRYQETLGGYQQRQQAAMTALEGLGGAERARLEKQFGQEASRQRVSLMGRGLAGTSVASGVGAKMAGAQQDAMNQLNERLTRERLGYQTGLSGDTLGFMERREDAYPDLQQMLMLAQMQGKSGAQGFGGYGSYGLGAMGWGYPMNAKKINQFFPGIG